MVMNKKGFLKILEAIIAIIIVLGFVIAILPTKPKDTAKFPPDLEQTTDSLLKEIQKNPDFRRCVLGEEVSYDFDNDGGPESFTSAECVNGYIELLSSPVTAHPWNYSVRICKVNSTGSSFDCNYHPAASDEENFVQSLPQDRDIYTKSITITVPDVSGQDSDIAEPGNYTSLKIYAWSK